MPLYTISTLPSSPPLLLLVSSGNVGAVVCVGVVGGELLFERDSRGNRRFFGGAAASDNIGGDSENKKVRHVLEVFCTKILYLDDCLDYRIDLHL